MRYTKETFYKKCEEVHNNFYTYTYDFTKVQEYITVICPIHGEYKTKGYVHMNGSKCAYCANKKKDVTEAKRKIAELGFELLDDFTKVTEKVTVKCTHGHITKKTVYNIISKQLECLECSYKTRHNTMVANGHAAATSDMSYKEIYYKEVFKCTIKTLKEYKIEDIDKRGKDFHLDHIFSIIHGFNNNIIPCIIGSYINLRIIPAKDNHIKCQKSDISIHELFDSFESSTTIPKGSTAK